MFSRCSPSTFRTCDDEEASNRASTCLEVRRPLGPYSVPQCFHHLLNAPLIMLSSGDCLRQVETVSQRWGLAAHHSRVKRPAWWKNFAILWRREAGGEGEDACPKVDSPHALTVSEQHLLKAREGAPCRNSTSNSEGHLEIGHQWSDQHHLDCFKDS